MSLSRRSLFAALPAVPLLLKGSEAQAAPLPAPKTSVPLLHPWGMVEHRTIQDVKDCLFEKPADIPAYAISEEGISIVQISKNPWVIVPTGRWSRGSRNYGEPFEAVDHKDVLDRLSAVLSTTVLNTPHTMTKDFSQHIGDADRACRDPKPKAGAPDLYVLSNGPIGYMLTDARDPERYGLIIFSHRIRVVGIEGTPVHT